MKRRSHRPHQVAEIIRQVVAEALTRDVRDPRIGRVAVTGVKVSGDLGHARVLVTIPGDDEERTRALEGLQSASGFMRTRVARTLATRIVPELEFRIDQGAEQAARIDHLLARIRKGGDP